MRFSALPLLALLLLPTLVLGEEKAEPEGVAGLVERVQKLPGKVQELLEYAVTLTGVDYKYGGNDPDTGLDCSGFVKHVFREALGFSLPHNALAISLLGMKIPTADLKPGDLVFFNTMRRAFTHVGIYLGDNRFIHATSSGGVVQVSDMREPYWAQRFNGARRLHLPLTDRLFR